MGRREFDWGVPARQPGCMSATSGLGILRLTNGYQVRQTICDAANVKANLCTKNQLGSFLLSKNASDVSKSPIISRAIHLKDPDAIKYPIKKTGFYCVSTYAYSTEDYKAVITFRNSYGELPATQVPKLPFYGAMTIVYAAIGLYVSLDSVYSCISAHTEI